MLLTCVKCERWVARQKPLESRSLRDSNQLDRDRRNRRNEESRRYTRSFNRMKPPLKLKFASPAGGKPEGPEALFRDLKTRSPQIQHLWSHQADILRAYQAQAKQKDIALELPTGTGKTLVGLLIAEWRRVSMSERALYVCPTRQLAWQVGDRAKEYGINAHVLVGSQVKYDLGQFADYQSAGAIAITTYSGLFNTNPRLSDPQVIVLDDAHAGENYIGKMWTVAISRLDHKDLYHSLLDLFAADLPQHFVATAQDDKASPDQRQTVEIVPGPKVCDKSEAISAHLESVKKEDGEVYYGWQVLRGHIPACNVFASWSEIAIRPWIPPALTHKPFSAASQRVFMSATLGEAGELERMAGIHSIHRIPVPAGWEQQSTGRRLFLAPDRSFTSEQYMPWLLDFLKSHERDLILSPSGTALAAIEKEIKAANIPHEILHSDDIEDSLDAFTTKSPAILSLAGRYDGIDLPGDACRIIVIYGLPSSVNLQEEFLWSRLGLAVLLRDRIRTRITQAAGRCTRNATDYAVVVLAGPKLLDFVIRKENQALFHPEFRAELQFGLDNSQVDDPSVLTDLAILLLDHRPEWKAVEADIVQRRSETVAPRPAAIETLKQLASAEVEFAYDLWRDGYDAALKGAAAISDKLSGDELAPYRALWNYFSGCAAYCLYLQIGKEELKRSAGERFRVASHAVRAVPMFARLAHELSDKLEAEPKFADLDWLCTENVEKFLVELGFVGPKFDRATEHARSELQKTDPDSFDRGVTQLGRMLGYRAHKPDGNAAPDSVWEIGNTYFAVLEAKSDETPGDPISVATCRQASGHTKWLKAQPFVPHNVAPAIVVVSPRSKLDKAAVAHADGLHYLGCDELRKLFNETTECLRAIRSKAANLDSNDRLKIITEERKRAKLTHEDVAARLTRKPLQALPS